MSSIVSKHSFLPDEPKAKQPHFDGVLISKLVIVLEKNRNTQNNLSIHKFTEGMAHIKTVGALVMIRDTIFLFLPQNGGHFQWNNCIVIARDDANCVVGDRAFCGYLGVVLIPSSFSNQRQTFFHVEAKCRNSFSPFGV